VIKPGLEIVAADRPKGPFRAAVFDFDDTLSLLRSGWQQVMLAQALAELRPHLPLESPDDLAKSIFEYIDELTGRPTIHQMERLAQEVAKRGGAPRTAEAYKQEYAAQLAKVTDERIAAIHQTASTDSVIVRGADEILRSLRQREVQLILCSGTDDDAVQSEMRLLQLDGFFFPHIYGAPLADPTFTKGRVFDWTIQNLGFSGNNIVAFGDGVVEIHEARRVGGLAIGVAKWSPEHPGEFARHRSRLIEAGAHAIIPDYEAHDEILALLGMEA
jgi:phosphoglycolate phosphatase